MLDEIRDGCAGTGSQAHNPFIDLEALRTGDEEQLANVISSFGVRVTNACRSFLRSTVGSPDGAGVATASECLSYALLKFVENLTSNHFDHPRQVYSWLKKTALRHCIDMIRRERRYRRDVSWENLLELGKNEAIGDAFADYAEVSRLFDELEPKERELLFLKYYLEMTSTEIAQYWQDDDISAVAVRARCSRLLQRIRQSLRSEAEEEQRRPPTGVAADSSSDPGS